MEKFQPENYTTKYCNAIGVNVSVTIHNDIEVTEAERLGFSLNEFRYFIEHVMLFGEFAVDQYRVVVKPDGAIKSENELGLLYPPTEIRHQLYWWGEKQSHEIAHAFVGGHLRFMGHESVGLGEGLTHLVGLMGTHPAMWVEEIDSDIKQYHDVILGNHVDLPLREMARYSNTNLSNTYYCKGGLLFATFGVHLNQLKPGSFCAFLRALIQSPERFHLTVPVMAQAANDLLPQLSQTFDAFGYLTGFFNSTSVFDDKDLDALQGEEGLANLRNCPQMV
jgi:hypothetical protein